MEDIVFTTTKRMSPAARQQLGLYRHAVFVEHLKWELPSISAETLEEWDEFDRDDSTNVIVYTPARAICGYARLLPTTRPYLLGEIFPDLCSSPLINDPLTWELSRFTTFQDGDAVNVQRMHRLLASIFLYARQLGIRRLIGVAPCSMQRLYRRLGIVLQPIGPIHIGRGRVAAFALDVDTTELRALRVEHLLTAGTP